MPNECNKAKRTRVPKRTKGKESNLDLDNVIVFPRHRVDTTTSSVDVTSYGYNH